MIAISEADVLAALRTVQEPELGGDLVTRNMIRDLVIDGGSGYLGALLDGLAGSVTTITADDAIKGGKKGDDLKVSWVDSKGATDTTTAKIL